MPNTIMPVVNLKAQWRRQILQCRRGLLEARKGWVAYSYFDQAESYQPFVEIGNLLVLVMYEDEFRNQDGAPTERTPLRLCGYSARRVAHGVQWGGVENTRLYKDLTLVPRLYAAGQRIDIRKDELLASALQLDRCLARAARYPTTRRGGMRLPQLWAGFRSDAACAVRGEGPEFEDACHQTASSPESVIAGAVREFDGLTLWPLEWVSGQLQCAVTLFAEMTGFRRPKVARIGSFPEGLIGFQGASEFDFYHNQFRRVPLIADGDRSADRNGERGNMLGYSEMLPLPIPSMPTVPNAC